MKIGTLISMLSASTQKFSISMQRLLKTARRDGKRIKSILSRFPKMDFLACTLSCPQAHTAKRTSEDTNLAQNALQPEWGNFPFAIWNGICWGLPLQLVNLIKVHFLPHLESFILERKFEKINFKKHPIQPPNGVLSICKLLFPNGSYRNGVCRGLWAK